MGEGRISGGDQRATDESTGRRLSVSEAAEALGISDDAVRSRIKRGTLPTVREGGRVFVVLGAIDRPTAQAQPTHAPGEDRLYQEMQARIRYLEEQVEEEREARRRADTLLARLMDRLPELETPQEAPPATPGSSSDAPEQPGKVVEPQEPVEGAQSGPSPPWLGLFRESGKAVITTLVTQAVGAALAALAYVQDELRLSVGLIVIAAAILAAAFVYVRQRTEDETLEAHPLFLVIAGVVVFLLVFVVAVYGYTTVPGWVGVKP